MERDTRKLHNTRVASYSELIIEWFGLTKWRNLKASSLSHSYTPMKTLATKYSYTAYVVACLHVRIYINIHHDYVGYNYKYACTHVQVYIAIYTTTHILCSYVVIE